MLENIACRSKQKALTKTKGYEVLVVIDKCVSVTPNIKLHSQNVQSKTNLRIFNIHNNKVLCLLILFSEELCHLQRDYTLVFKTQWSIVPHNNNKYFDAVTATTKFNRVTSCNKSPPTQSTRTQYKDKIHNRSRTRSHLSTQWRNLQC